MKFALPIVVLLVLLSVSQAAQAQCAGGSCLAGRPVARAAGRIATAPVRFFRHVKPLRRAVRFVFRQRCGC